jgi:hypothetical protein
VRCRSMLLSWVRCRSMPVYQCLRREAGVVHFCSGGILTPGFYFIFRQFPNGFPALNCDRGTPHRTPRTRREY